MKRKLFKIILPIVAGVTSIAAIGSLVSHEIAPVNLGQRALHIRGKLPFEMTTRGITVKGIKFFENFYEKPYICPAGVPTIGYGFTDKQYLAKGTITKAEASLILDHELGKHCEIVKRYVKVKLTEEQLYALASFTFNCGEGSLKQLVNGKGRLNSGNYKSVPTLMMKYKCANGKPLKGLELRRAWEAKLWKA